MNPPEYIIIPSPGMRRRPVPPTPWQGRPFACLAFFIMMVAILVREHIATSTDVSNSESIKLGSAPERGKHLGNVITAQHLFKVYLDIQNEYQTKAFDSDGWIMLYSKDGVSVSMLQHSSDQDCPYVKMTSIMPVSPKACWDFLSISNWDKTMPHMDPFYEGVSIYETHHHRGVSMTLARKRTKRLLALGKRDFFFASVADLPRKDGTLVSGTVSVIAPRLMPRQAGYTRAFQDSIAFYKPIDSGSKTELTIVCRIDLNDSGPDGDGGFMPMWLYSKTIGTTGVRSVLSMRNFLERELQLTSHQVLPGGGLKCQMSRLHSFLFRAFRREWIG